MSEHHHEPRRDPQRLAYFLTSYGDGAQLQRLVRTLRAGDPDAEIVLAHDPSHHPLDRGPLDALGVHVLGADATGGETVEWGDLSLERIRWHVFGWILEHLDVDWVMLLSEQDYPTAPARVLRDRIAATDANAIVQAWPIDDIPDPEIRVEADQRYRFRYHRLPGPGVATLPAPIARVLEQVRGIAIHRLREHRMPVRMYAPIPALGVPARIGFRALRTPFTRDEPCWFDNCWFALDRTAMAAVVERTATDPAFVRHFERTLIPVEAATATILGNHPGIRIENAPLHTIRWSDHRSGRPDVFTIDDVPMLTASGLPFARKFGPDPRVLDALDEHVLIPAP